MGNSSSTNGETPVVDGSAPAEMRITLRWDKSAGSVRLGATGITPSPILCAMHDNAASLFDVSHTGGGGTVSERIGAVIAQPIRAHKAILARASPHLRDLFTSEGYTDSNKNRYTISMVSHEVLQSIVKLIYTNEVEIKNVGAVECVRRVLLGAKYLIIKDLADACESFLASDEQITVQNCIDVRSFSIKYQCTKMSDAAATFITNNLLAVSQSEKFLELSLEECVKFLLSKPVVSANADHRCRAGIAWLNHGQTLSRADSAQRIAAILSIAAFDADGVTSETLLLAVRSPVIWPAITGFTLNLIDALAKGKRELRELFTNCPQQHKTENLICVVVYTKTNELAVTFLKFLPFC